MLASQQSLSQGEFDQTLLGYEPIYEGDIVYTLSMTVLGKAQLVTVLVYQYLCGYVRWKTSHHYGNAMEMHDRW